MIKLTFHSIVDRDIQEVCGSSRILTAVMLKFAWARWGAVALHRDVMDFVAVKVKASASSYTVKCETRGIRELSPL